MLLVINMDTKKAYVGDVGKMLELASIIEDEECLHLNEYPHRVFTPENVKDMETIFETTDRCLMEFPNIELILCHVKDVYAGCTPEDILDRISAKEPNFSSEAMTSGITYFRFENTQKFSKTQFIRVCLIKIFTISFFEKKAGYQMYAYLFNKCDISTYVKKYFSNSLASHVTLNKRGEIVFPELED